jgi:hypothetical protein
LKEMVYFCFGCCFPYLCFPYLEEGLFLMNPIPLCYNKISGMFTLNCRVIIE